MWTIDGGQGEGGGQVLRTALTLSLVTGTPLRIERIRAKRKRPGLMRQHLTAVEAARSIGDASVAGAAIGSGELTFEPRAVAPGHHHFAVGTAGSATLVLQTVLPALLTAPAPSTLVLEGGTHNPMAPPFDFLDRAYLPLVRRLGPRVEARLERHGFAPAGGGRFQVVVTPVPRLEGFELLDAGSPVAQRGRVLFANLPRSIAERERKTILDRTGWAAEAVTLEAVDADGPGNAVVLEAENEHTREVFSAFGRRGVRAEAIASDAVRAWRRWRVADVPVGEYRADQLILLLALAGGGAFRTLRLSRHAETQIDWLRHLHGTSIQVEDAGAGVIVRVG